MPILCVRHVTIYRYARPVRFGPHQLLFRPRDSFDQRLLSAELAVRPAPAAVRWVLDVFGNCVAQARAEAAGLAHRVRFRLHDYREVTETFDHIVSVGMFEHVGKRQFPIYFRTAARLLAPDGVMLLHSMTQPAPSPYNQPFIEKYIFPGGYIPEAMARLAAAELDFPDYAGLHDAPLAEIARRNAS